MPDCQSGAVHSLVCGIIIYSAVAGDIGVCHADCHEGDCRKAVCDQGCSSVRSARLSPEKETGAGWHIRNGQADRLLQGSQVRSIWRTRAICVRASITGEVTGRAAECESPLGRTTAGAA